MSRLWRHARTAWIALSGTGAAASAAVGLLVFGCVFLSVAAPRESLALRTRALRADLSHVGALGRSVYAAQDYSGFKVAVHRVDESSIAAARSRIAGGLTAARLPLAAADAGWSGLASGYSSVAGAPAALYHTRLCTPPQMEVVYRDKLSDYAPLLAGRYPDVARSVRGGSVFQVAVTQATATRFGLRVGSRLGIGQRVTIAVTGIVRVAKAGSPFWTADPAVAAPQLQADHNSNCPPYWDGAALIGPAELGPLESGFDIAGMTVSWDYPLRLRGIQASQAVAVLDGLNRAEGQAGQLATEVGYLSASGTPVNLTSGVGSLLASFIAQDQAVGSVLSLLSVSLAAIAAAIVLLGSFLIAEHRKAELAVMRSRGASRYQLAGTVLRAGAAVAIPAAVAGGWLAIGLTPRDGTSLSWWLAGSTLLVAVAGPPAVAAARHGPPTSRTGRRLGSSTKIGAVRRLVAEVSVTAASIGGLVLLRQHAQPGSDIYSELAPVLVAIPAALVVMRCYPVVLTGLVKLAGRLQGPTAFVGLARAARTAPRAILPTFALVLALSAVGFGTMTSAAVARGQVIASWQRVGADALVNATGPTYGVTQEARHAVGGVPGVQHLVTATLTSGRTAKGKTLQVAAMNPQAYAALTADTPLGAFPASKLTPAGGEFTAGGPFPALVTRRAAAALSAGSARLTIGTRTITVKATGAITGLVWAPGPLIVLPAAALAGTAMPPNIILVTGHHLDGRGLESVTRRVIPGARTMLRSAVLTDHADAPVPRGAYRALVMASGAAAGLIALVVLIALVLSAPSRADTLARLTVMGLERRQARWLVTTEVLPQILLAAVGGFGCAATLAPLLAPAIDLSALTGSPSSVSVTTQPIPLAITAAGLLAVAMLTVGLQTAVVGRSASLRAIRVNE